MVWLNSNLYLLKSELVWVLNLSSNLSLASLAAPPSLWSWSVWFSVLLHCSSNQKENPVIWTLPMMMTVYFGTKRELMKSITEEERWAWLGSQLLVYKQKALLRDPTWAPPVPAESEAWWNLLRRAHSTPGSIPAIFLEMEWNERGSLEGNEERRKQRGRFSGSRVLI